MIVHNVNILDIPLSMNAFIDIVCDARSDTLIVTKDSAAHKNGRALLAGLKTMGIAFTHVPGAASIIREKAIISLN